MRDTDTERLNDKKKDKWHILVFSPSSVIIRYFALHKMKTEIIRKGIPGMEKKEYEAGREALQLGL